MSARRSRCAGLTSTSRRRRPRAARSCAPSTTSRSRSARAAITALVGESGSGKSTVARLLSRLYAPTGGHDPASTARTSAAARPPRPARVPLAGADDLPGPVRLAEPGQDGRAPHRAAAADPRHRAARAGRRARARAARHASASSRRSEIAAKYPHQLSGGQRQRVAIARALAVEPAVVLADEPISMLDVSIRIGVLNLMRELKEERGIAFLYITHDIASARYVADEMLVMYAGQIVEQGPTDEVLPAPAAPVHAAPALGRADPRDGSPAIGRKGAPAQRSTRRRLPLRRRCPLAIDVCSHDAPARRGAARPGVRCHVTAPATSKDRPCRSSSFPHDFLWGAAHRGLPDRGRRRTRTAAARASGTASAPRPGKVRNGDTGAVACDHYHRYPRGHRADARARPRRLPLLDRVAARSSPTAAAG